MKKIEVLVKADVDWLNHDNMFNLDFITGRVTSNLEEKIYSAVVKKVLENIEIPKVKINKNKLMGYIYKELANKKVWENNNL